MKRQILTVTMELLVPEDAEQDYPKGYDRMTHIGSFLAAMLQGFSPMVVRRHVSSVIDLGNEGE